MNPRYARFSDVYKRIKTLMSHVCGEDILVKWTHPACNQSFITIMDKKKRNAYRILVRKPEGKRPLGRPRSR
jgi:hypothetical protein